MNEDTALVVSSFFFLACAIVGVLGAGWAIYAIMRWFLMFLKG